MLSIFFFIGYLLSLACSFYFSGTEAGFLSLNKHKHQGNLRAGHVGAHRLDPYVREPKKILSLTLFGNNLANVAASMLVLSIGALYFLGHRHFIYIEFGLLIFTNVLLFLFGEVLPKIFFKAHANEILYSTAPLLKLSEWFFKPFTKLITTLSDFLLMPLRLRAKSMESISRHDFNHLLYNSIEEGLVEQDEKYSLSTIASLSTIKVVEVMVPLADLILINKNQRVATMIEEIKTQKHDMIPVYEGRIDHLIGYINIMDVYHSRNRKKYAKDYLLETDYVPETSAVDKVYLRFAEKNNKAFIVVNEYGGCSGMVTKEQVIKRIFGFSYAFRDQNKGEMISQIEDHLYEVDTHFDIDDLNERLGLHLPKEGYETLGGVLHHLAGTIPKRGEKLRWENVEWEITEARKTGVDKVRMRFLDKRIEHEEKEKKQNQKNDKTLS